jgi:hypothetical protein
MTKEFEDNNRFNFNYYLINIDNSPILNDLRQNNENYKKLTNN